VCPVCMYVGGTFFFKLAATPPGRTRLADDAASKTFCVTASTSIGFEASYVPPSGQVGPLAKENSLTKGSATKLVSLQARFSLLLTLLLKGFCVW
jgi:hypothetical protein